MKGRSGLEGHQEWSQDWGEGILLQVPGDLFVTWSPGRDAYPDTHTYTVSSFLCFFGVCRTCLATAGPLSSFIQQIFTELLNPVLAWPQCPCAFPSLSFPHLRGGEAHPCLSHVTSLEGRFGKPASGKTP